MAEPMREIAGKVINVIRKPFQSPGVIEPSNSPLNRRNVSRRTALAALPFGLAALGAVVSGAAEAQPVTAKEHQTDTRVDASVNAKTRNVIIPVVWQGEPAAPPIGPDVPGAAGDDIDSITEPIEGVAVNGVSVIPGEGALERPSDTSKPRGVIEATTEGVSDTQTAADLEVAGNLVELFSDGAIKSRFDQLESYEVFWISTQSNHPLKGKAADTLKLIIATYEVADGDIGKAARNLKLLIEKQNNPQTKGQQQWIHKGNRFEATLTPVIKDDLTDKSKPVNFASLNDRLQVVGNSVKMPVLLEINPRFLEFLTGESRVLEGKKDLTTGRQAAFVVITLEELNRSLQQATSDYLRGRNSASISTQELRDHLLSRYDGLMAEAVAEGNSRSAAGAKELYQSMPGFWYVDEGLRREIE